MSLKIFHLRSRRAARWISASVCLLFLVLLVGGLAPAILGSRLCWPTVLAYLTADFDGQVASRSVSLGWFSPVVLQGVSIEDREGQTLAQVEAVRTESSLLSLLLSSAELGVIHIDKPALTVVLRDDGSNLEDALESLLAKRSSVTVTGSMEITAGSVDVVDGGQTHIAQLSSIGATIQLPAADKAQGTVTLDGCHLAIGSQSGDCAARLQWQADKTSPDWSLSTRIQGMGLSFIQALARRLGEDVQADGVLTADVHCQWNGAQRSLTVDVRQATAQLLRLSAPAWLSSDQLQLPLLRVAGSCAVDDGRWQFKHAELECDAGRFTLDGQFAWQSETGTSAWHQLLRSAASADLQMDGRVDLARLAQTLPHTLRIREGSAIEAGTVQVHLRSRQEAQQHGWLAKVETSELVAIRDGRRFTWNDPLRVSMEFAQGQQGWNVQQLACRSSFLQLTGQGTPQSGSFALTCDLARLVSELHQLFELGALQAAGALSTQLRWQRSDDGRVAVSGVSTIDNLELAAPPRTNWREPHLQATLALEAETEGPQLKLKSIRTGRVELTSATDRLDLQLLEPVSNPGRDATWSVGGVVRGQIANWLARVHPFLPGMSADGSGSMQLEFTSRVSPRSLAVQQLVFHCEPLRFSSSGVNIDEQTVHMELAGSWDFGLHQGSIPDAQFQSSALALRATDVSWSLEAAQPRLTGDAAFRADLARLQTSWQVPSAQQNWRTAGSAQGQVSLVQHEGSTQARWTVDLTGVELARRTGTTTPDMLNVIPAAQSAAWQTVWKEPVLKLVGSGQYDGSRQVARFDQFDVTAADALKLSGKGSITCPFAQCEVDLKGQVTYDLAKLVERLWPHSRFRMSGQDTQSFTLRGPLFHAPQTPMREVAVREVAVAEAAPRGLLPPALSGLGGLRWQSADLFGMAVGPGLVSAKLAAGTIETDVVEMPFSQGTLRIVPHVLLNNEPPLVTVDTGQILTDVSISPGMCQSWLKYVAPLAADATRAEGKFSLALERAAIPLEQPATAQVQGTLLIDSAHIGPGPLAQQLIDLSAQVESLVQGRLPSSATRESMTWVSIPQQRTRFQLVDGRVHHDRFELHIDNAVVTTRGSVGFDQSLALVAQVPLQDAWLARDKRLAALQGMTVEIPISGTFSRPRLDAKALEQLSAQVLRQTANRLLEEGVHRGLEQLLGPRR